METTGRVALIVVSAVIVSIIGLAFKGVAGAIFGFLLTLLVIGLFIIWRRYRDSD